MDGRMYEYVKKRRRSRIKKKGKSSILCILPLCQGSFHSPFDVEPDIRIIMVWKNINLHRKWLLFKYYLSFFFQHLSFPLATIHYYTFWGNGKYIEVYVSLLELHFMNVWWLSFNRKQYNYWKHGQLMMVSSKYLSWYKKWRFNSLQSNRNIIKCHVSYIACKSSHLFIHNGKKVQHGNTRKLVIEIKS